MSELEVAGTFLGISVPTEPPYCREALLMNTLETATDSKLNSWYRPWKNEGGKTNFPENCYSNIVTNL
jgi:hypothetical protein